MAAPLALNHIGMTVPDIDHAIDWYGSVMGFRLIFRRLMEYQPQIPEVREIFGPQFVRAHQAHLLSANGVGIELFQFLEPAVAAPWKALWTQNRARTFRLTNCSVSE